jgi:hypothetical protein
MKPEINLQEEAREFIYGQLLAYQLRYVHDNARLKFHNLWQHQYSQDEISKAWASGTAEAVYGTASSTG